MVGIIIIIIIIIIIKCLTQETSPDRKRSVELISTGFYFGVFHPPGRSLTRLMRLPPQDLKIRVYLRDSYLTWQMGLSPQNLKIRVYILLDSYLTWLITLS